MIVIIIKKTKKTKKNNEIGYWKEKKQPIFHKRAPKIKC
jgi:hypothetical protein